ncbi:MAG TPA: alpha/beta hydrolase [Actinophytocola sp.]|jgi:pimeloyl-ACP methyl ester carboxylesterase|nr:alpha/beta hydrolase [Actinophytocola sp.]
MTTATTRTGTIRADGAHLYYERRGSGPALLMIPGGGGDASHFTDVADRLADTYTVLGYDRRGNSRSTVDDPAAPLRMETQSADALAVLAHHDLGSALVVGGSGGALIGLDLAARRPDAVVGLVAHEPPVIGLLPDAASHRALFDEIDEITRREGPWAGYVRFVSTIDRPDSPALLHRRGGRRLVGGAARAGVRLAANGPRSLREIGRVLGNSPYLMTREMASFLAFTPDLFALATGGVPIVIGAGARSRGYYPGRGGAAVAERLGVPLVEFPGGHIGYLEEPDAFAATLRETLAGLRPDSHL